MTRDTENTSGLNRAAAGGGGNKPIIIENIIKLDGRVIDTRIK